MSITWQRRDDRVVLMAIGTIVASYMVAGLAGVLLGWFWGQR